MHGNVREWCRDWYGTYTVGPVIDPGGAVVGSRRVRRAGSWYSNKEHLSSAKHHSDGGNLNSLGAPASVSVSKSNNKPK